MIRLSFIARDAQGAAVDVFECNIASKNGRDALGGCLEQALAGHGPDEVATVEVRVLERR